MDDDASGARRLLHARGGNLPSSFMLDDDRCLLRSADRIKESRIYSIMIQNDPVGSMRGRWIRNGRGMLEKQPDALFV